MADDLQARLRALEDREAIRELRATYCFLVDGGRPEELVEGYFTQDARCEFGSAVEGGMPSLVASGREEVRRFFVEVVPALLDEMSHTVHNHRIVLNGDRASGDCYFELTALDRASGEPVLGAGRYTDEYRRVEGGWRFSSRRADIHFIAPLAEGWVRQRFPASLVPPEAE
jgi:hypothetical protein